MWQKERLLNLAIERVPEQYTKIAWLDSDILFLNQTWVEEAEKALDDKLVVQLFEVVERLDERSRPECAALGTAAASARRTGRKSGSPGGAWAARRDVLPLFDDHILGGSDQMTASAWLGDWKERRFRGLMNDAWYQEYLKLGIEQYEKVRGNVGFVSGEILHFWHGARLNRDYADRWEYLALYDYQPSLDIQLDSNGLWTWASDKTDMQALVRHYFRERREDGG
jgi:hypothetical protein